MMKAYSSLSFMALLACISSTSSVVNAEKQGFVVFNTPPELNGVQLLSADVRQTFDFYVSVGQKEFLDWVSASMDDIQAEVDEDGNVRRQLRAGEEDERDLQGCPPRDWTCKKCRNHPSWGYYICAVCGNCRRRTLMEQLFPTKETTLETSSDDPMAGWNCAQVNDDTVQADITNFFDADESFAAFAGGLDPAHANVRVYTCER